MFQLAILSDIVRILPTDFIKPTHIAVTDALDKKYSNKVLHDVGLCIKTYKLLETSDPIVHACQDGSYQCTGTL
jgi:DNA-directed RNA polymerase III subunit RPC8